MNWRFENDKQLSPARRWQVGGTEIPIHVGVALAMIVFGVGVWINPAFPFRGDLLGLHPLIPYVYGGWFVVSGGLLLRGHPRPLRYLLVTIPLFTHLTGNLVDIGLTALERLLPIWALYGLLLFLLIKAYQLPVED